MKNILLIRHAKSDWSHSLPDFDRALSSRGRHDAERMGKVIRPLIKTPCLFLASSSQRTRETVQRLVDSLDDSIVKTRFTDQLYLANSSTIKHLIKKHLGAVNSLIVIAHNPGMDDVVENLAGYTPPLTENGKLMTTCAVAFFQASDTDLSLSKPELRQVIRPKDIY
jgi:phosphohistidine phosphatase